MRDFLDYIDFLLSEDAAARDRVVEVVLSLYFIYINPWYRTLKFSDESKIARDIIAIKRALRTSATLLGLRLRSRELKSLAIIKSNFCVTGLEQYMVRRILDELSKYDHIVLAVFIAEIVERETIRERLRWISTLLLGALTAGITLLGVIYAK